MAGLIDLLSAIGVVPPQSAPQASGSGDQTPVGTPPPTGATYVNPQGQPVNPNATTSLGGVTATAPTAGNPLLPPSGSPGQHTVYDNTPELQAIQGVEQKYPEGGSAGNQGSGLGLENLIGAHGTLRNLLGTLGDAFLISSGHTPIHAEVNYRQQIADAGAGFENDPQAAASRILATGAPGSVDAAQKMYDASNQYKLRQAQEEQNSWYRQNTVNNQQNNQVDKMGQYVGAMVSKRNPQTKQDYQQVFDQATANAKRINPTYDASVFGLPDPEHWDPSMTTPGAIGATAGQVMRDTTSNASIAERAAAANQRNNTTIRGQNIGAGNNAARVGATVRGQDMTNSADIQRIQTQVNQGKALAPGDQAIWDKAKNIPGSNKPHLNIPGLTPTGAKPAAPATQQQFQENGVYQDAHGNKARYSGGKWIPVH